MSDRVEFGLSGVAELVATLNELNSVSATKVGETSTREASKIIRDAFIAAAPVGTEPTRKTRRVKSGRVVAYDYGRLRANIRSRKLKAQREHQVRFGVGIGDAFWGMFLEFGTRHQAATPWLRPAFDAVAGRVVEEIGRLLGRGIEREGKRLRRKARKLGI